MIKLLKLLITNKKTTVFFILLGITSGLFNLGIISLINEMIKNALVNNKEENVAITLTWFLAFIVCWFITRKILAVSLIRLTQKTLWQYRSKIIGGLSKSNYIYVHKNKSKIYAILTEDVSEVAAATASLVDFLISSVTIIAVFIYLAYLSLYFFLITILVVAFGIFIYEVRGRKNVKRFQFGKTLLDKFHLNINSLLGGFKEAKLDQKKTNAIKSDIAKIGSEAIENNSKAYISFLDNEMIGQVAFYLLVALIAMFLGNYLQMESGEIVTYLFTLLFIQGPIELILILLPNLTRAGVALERITGLELPVTELNEKEEIEPFSEENFHSLKVTGLSFEYLDDSSQYNFIINDINLVVNKGEVVFISGGNGSGKTTLINLILSLLTPSAGTISVNGNSDLYVHNKKQYRSLFAPVFSDFYLFEELYGIPEPDQIMVENYLKLFEIDHKVTYENRKFSTKDLSTGQRKRLALIGCILEQKPILVLDEWAADQDPQFRKKFYRVILPMLKAEGFTIIAITHDDSYFDAADRLLKMHEGKLE